MEAYPTISLKPIVRFCEYPFGPRSEPSMREFMADSPRQHQDDILAYLRSGIIHGIPIGGRVKDPFDRTKYADVHIDGKLHVCCTTMIDGVWFWFAGLIYFVENYNLKLPDEFVDHAKGHGWHVNREVIPIANYKCDEFFAAAI